MTRILVTGSSGFVGNSLLEQLSLRDELELAVLVRSSPIRLRDGVDYYNFSDFSEIDADHDSLVNVSVLIHLASRVHIMNDTAADPLSAFRAVNVAHTLNLARSAASAGVKRFIFISSVKVNGEGTPPGCPYKETDTPNPQDFYGISKMEAEEGLRAIAAETGIEVVIIRPVLVYGPGVKANFENMMRWLQKGLPLPLGAIHNQRSLVGLDNLVDMIQTCVSHPAAANETFLVSDGEDVSTSQLLRELGAALNKPTRLVAVPQWVLVSGATLLGKKDFLHRLCGSLQVDISKARTLLGWQPVLTLDQALRKTAEHFISEQKK
ncbi:SDR family oxidoreductase [Pseudomonas sp. NIBR-H-19]|uniref:UDP-glucose 4-epimerase family protein n=1 Tax=Pseudomonas TaxID=286 RepID=UPI001E5CAB01|nr:SDR family oxidoreductase [Pseudomonas sp. NIBR-H-19]UHC82554.1 SDR family oxidoreductase [Pseudomonas sp. NIBR-H-19]